MDAVVNYWWAILGLLLLALLVIWLIMRNFKDQKKFEKEQMQSELKPGEHDVNQDTRP
ncbi:hypothetical protein [Mucilaginibacter antarcticus]|uniref:Uncharacterized protein n=1 Tax=Mucilaginibacter antarcticus TaxID=1855725 RepID=A0ABW5XIJ9_9SPHI